MSAPELGAETPTATAEPDVGADIKTMVAQGIAAGFQALQQAHAAALAGLTPQPGTGVNPPSRPLTAEEQAPARQLTAVEAGARRTTGSVPAPSAQSRLTTGKPMPVAGQPVA